MSLVPNSKTQIALGFCSLGQEIKNKSKCGEVFSRYFSDRVGPLCEKNKANARKLQAKSERENVYYNNDDFFVFSIVVFFLFGKGHGIKIFFLSSIRPFFLALNKTCLLLGKITFFGSNCVSRLALGYLVFFRTKREHIHCGTKSSRHEQLLTRNRHQFDKTIETLH